MIGRLWISRSIIVVILTITAATAGARGQDAEQLLKQLCGKAQAPARSDEQLAQAYKEAIDYLLPLMSADDVGSRYNHQIALQDMGSHASRPGAEQQRSVLAQVMCRTIETTDMPATVRNWFVLQLERIGKEESVRTLGKLLSDDDKELRDYARRALEKNPSHLAASSLRRALKAASDPSWKIALLRSLGQRSELDVISSLTPSLGDENPQVVAAAVTALADAQCLQNSGALMRFLKGASGQNRIVAARALLDSAAGLVKHRMFDQALEIYEYLNNWAIDEQRSSGQDVFFIRAAALNGMASCSGQRAARIAAMAIRGENPKVRSIAVQAARNAPTGDAARVLTQMLPDLDPYFQKQVLALIADRADLSSVKFVKEVLGSNDESVRFAAINTLAKIGDDEAAEALMDIAVGGQGGTDKAAAEGLSVMAGPGVEQMIKARAASGDAEARVVAINLLGRRRTAGAAESLLGYAAEENAAISAAAFTALAAVADSSHIPMLADLVAKTKSKSARENGVSALKSVLAKAQDRDAAAKVVIEAMEAADAEAKVSLLTSLNALGGPVALKTAAEAARSPNDLWREAGIRTLSDWPDFEAAETLLEIASKPETTLTHYVLAVRGALRLITTSDSAPLDDRVGLCLFALDHARRDEEKKQAIAAMGSLPSGKAAERLLGLARGDSLKAEAGLAAVELAGNMLRTDRQAARDLAQKIRDLNISDEVNRRADSVIRGRRRR
jgi:HEAT repeat protein